jgi:hypothetical protein
MFTITRDGQPIATATTESEVLAWFHRNVSYSMHHATAYEGYAVQDDSGDPVLEPTVNGRTTLYY